MNGLVLDNISAGYGAVSVLHEVSLTVRQGELVALLGMNGNGKSTLLNAILGFVKPTAGEISLEWDGERTALAGRAPHRIVELGIGYVPEGRRLVPNLTVEENLRLAASGRARKDLAENRDFVFETFPILKERHNQLAGTMSGGQQQQLAIGRALMTSPRIMVIDEPSVGLAPIVVDQVIAAIKSLQEKRNMTILMAEQSFFQAVEVASRAYVLAHGRIVHAIEGGLDSDAVETIRKAMMGID